MMIIPEANETDLNMLLYQGGGGGEVHDLLGRFNLEMQ
jgi:hypothetical protein